MSIKYVKTKFHEVAKKKCWTLESIGERWDLSERQMSRIANGCSQRSLDAVNGLPYKMDPKMNYENLVHDQALYCAIEGLELYKQLALLSRQKDSKDRRRKAKTLDKRFSSISSRSVMLMYVYTAAERDDLNQLMMELEGILANEALLAIQDPEGWEVACGIAGNSSDIEVSVPEKDFLQWRIDFMSAINRS